MSLREPSLRTFALTVALLPLAALTGGCGFVAKTSTERDTGAQTAFKKEPGDGATAVSLRQPWELPQDPVNDHSTSGPVIPVSGEELVGEPTVDLPEREPRAPSNPAPRPKRVEIVETENFDELVLASDVPVLVDFYADWCGPCKKLSPVLDQLARETPDVRVVKVNIDHSKKLAQTYRVRSIPTVMVFKDGVPVSHHTGLANRETLEQLLAR
jgi:thioredoxin 1